MDTRQYIEKNDTFLHRLAIYASKSHCLVIFGSLAPDIRTYSWEEDEPELHAGYEVYRVRRLG